MHSPNIDNSFYDSNDEETENTSQMMMLAIRAPPGSTLERPSEIQIKEMHALALKNREEFRNITNDSQTELLQREEYEDLLNYLSRKYQLFIRTNKQK